MIIKDNTKRGRPKGSKDKTPEERKLINNSRVKKPKCIHHDDFGEFKKGNKASLGHGRPVGSRNKSILILEQIGKDSAETILKHWIDIALGRTKEGDAGSCKGILDKVWGGRKGRSVDIDFGRPVRTIQDANKLSEHITTMMVTGEISAEEAEEYGKWIDKRMKHISDSDVMDKIDETYKKIDDISKL